uniref:14 kDa apolipoprotein n=1 Tax=Hypophthalmichthys molitrix TaxID=13095 RepID=D6R729_HYPMO|nr:14 kDa apolipoprotein [Hypophthalmichthys molitrix]
MKLTFALILALQVSVCFSTFPEPDKELVEKYTGLKEVFLKRLVTAYGKIKDAIQPLLESSPTGEKAKEVFEELKESPRVESAVKIISGLASELEPVVEKARLALLGAYGHYLRPYIGEHLDTAITNVKPVLDVVLPHDG